MVNTSVIIGFKSTVIRCYNTIVAIK